MSKIVLLVGAQMALLSMKESTNFFRLLLIFGHLDANVMFMFLILLSARQCIIADKKAL